MDFGVQIFGLRQEFNRDPQGVSHQLREAGLTFLEPRVMLREEPQLRGAAWTPAEFARFVPMLREAGMGLYSCHVYTLDLLGDLPGLVELAQQYEICQYVIPCPAFSSREEYEAQARMLTQAGKALQQVGVELLLHNGQAESAQTLDGVTVYAWLLRACQGAVGAQVDLGWLLAGGVDIPAFLGENRELIRSLHYKDMEQTPQGLQECAVGQGLLDIPVCSRFAFAQGWPQVVDQNGSRGDFLQDVRYAAGLLTENEA